jgi:hypothetical protein
MVGSGRTDVPITRWAYVSAHQSHAAAAGGEIIEFVSPTLHAMTGTIDGIYSSIGSFNWDRLSARRNLEVNLTVLDPTIATMMSSHFDAHLQSCTRVTVDSLKTRNVAQHSAVDWHITSCDGRTGCEIELRRRRRRPSCSRTRAWSTVEAHHALLQLIRIDCAQHCRARVPRLNFNTIMICVI